MDTYIEVDLDNDWVILDRTKYSKAGWTPFAGRRVFGKVRRVVLRSKTVFVDDKFLVSGGFGQNIRQDNLLIEGSSTISSTAVIPDMRYNLDIVQKQLFKFKLGHIYSVEQFTRQKLRYLFHRASELRQLSKDGKLDILKNRIIANLFYEPSTRTRCSFSAAVMNLGGQVIDISPHEASIQKGESLEDTF